MRFHFKTDYGQDNQLIKHGGQGFWYGLLMAVMLAAVLWAGDYWNPSSRWGGQSRTMHGCPAVGVLR